MAVAYDIPPVFKHYCRTCVRSTWHAVKDGSVGCSKCSRITHGAEIISIYSTDDYSVPPAVLLPRHALPQYDGADGTGDHG